MRLRFALLVLSCALLSPMADALFGKHRAEGLPDLVVQQISRAPTNPNIGQTVTFQVTVSNQGNASASSFWVRLQGEGPSDNRSVSSLAAGASVTRTFALPLTTSPETFTATADVYNQVVESNEANNTRTHSVRSLMLATGMPDMGTTPGIYVWGTDMWSITINGAPGWTTPRAYTVELRTDGTFIDVITDAASAPTGRVPEPIDEGWRILFEGEVGTGKITHAFRLSEASSVWMDLRLDMDGDGTPDRSIGIARLRQQKVAAPYSPVVLGVPAGHAGAFLPTVNFRIGDSHRYDQMVRIVFWGPNIEDLESADPNEPPVAQFAFTPTQPSTLDTVRFTDQSTDPDGEVVSWRWEFGDGNTSTLRNPTHRYTRKGTFTVRLTVTDDDGATDTTTRTITVVNLPPVASFTVALHIEHLGLVLRRREVTFDASESHDPDGDIVRYAWDFGDGHTAEGRIVTHTYPEAGTYNVRLTVTDDDGMTDTAEQEVRVVPGGGGGPG